MLHTVTLVIALAWMVLVCLTTWHLHPWRRAGGWLEFITPPGKRRRMLAFWWP